VADQPLALAADARAAVTTSAIGIDPPAVRVDASPEAWTTPML
jgi:hypothetical protein